MREDNLNNGIEYKFAAALVLYNPADQYYLTAIRILNELGIKVFLYDNTPNEVTHKNTINIIRNEFGDFVNVVNKTIGNIGLAVAFNLITTNVIADDRFAGLFVFDQDTNLNNNALKLLIETFKKLNKDKIDFGIIAGYPIRKEGTPYRIRPISYSRIYPNLLAVKTVSSSFSLIPLKTFKKIGLFDEDYFIDHIDMDFSMRCWKVAKPVFVNIEAKFTHNVGNGDVKVFGRFLFPIGDPYRHYYQVRNMILSYKKNGVRNLYIFTGIIVRTIVVMIISIYSGETLSRLGFLWRGISDGFSGVKGKMSSKY
ncbi:hypothetical protein QWY86_11415 [Pedobacter aquatilis]|uniref:hypothetical protein n=1 Tax=Pedobacter aquatilis TaxID=351343 RepID=UPI0025B40801|nr:hypothetical protein [Pedobacter aquatilis]MDN3587280.1 hypothetical protein [Pedobacter aquatilis]